MHGTYSGDIYYIKETVDNRSNGVETTPITPYMPVMATNLRGQNDFFIMMDGDAFYTATQVFFKIIVNTSTKVLTIANANMLTKKIELKDIDQHIFKMTTSGSAIANKKRTYTIEVT